MQTKRALTAVAVAAVVIAAWRYAKSRRDSFYTPGIGNTEIFGESPDWWLGSGDAGMGGNLQRDTTPQLASVFYPQLRRSYQIRAAVAKQQRRAAAKRQRQAEIARAAAAAERITTEAGQAAAKARALSNVLGKDHMLVKNATAASEQSWALPNFAEMRPMTCATGWAPAAAAEAVGLTAAQAFRHPATATGTLDRVVAGAIDDTSDGTTDAKIAQMFFNQAALYRDV